MRELISLLRGEQLDLPESRWRQVLDVADRNQSTTCVPDHGVPVWFQEAIRERKQKVHTRRRRLTETYCEAVEVLNRRGIEFVLIKGFSHEADARSLPGERVQNDIDLLAGRDDIAAIEAALLAAGFVFHSGPELSDNHGRPLLKPHSWGWKGDYFDPDMPVSIELHHSIWSHTRDRLPTQGAEAFWTRREGFPMGGFVFCDADRVGIAALHLLRHILRNNVRLAHAYELSRMMQCRGADLWGRWAMHPPELRRLASIAMKFVSVWFDVPMPEGVQAAWDEVSPSAHAWMHAHAYAPVDLEVPNKDVLWLHLALLPGWRDRASVARRRLLPVRFPGPRQAPDRHLDHLWSRSRFHAAALARLVASGVRSTARSMASHTSD